MGSLETGTLSFSTKRDEHFSEAWQVACFSQRLPAFFLPFSSFMAAFSGLFTDSQSTRLQPCPSVPWLFGFPWFMLSKGISLVIRVFSLVFPRVLGGSGGRENPW